MDGLGKQAENSRWAGECVERVLDAIQFQTAVLALNAAVEAAHTADLKLAPAALAGQLRNAAEHTA